MTLSPRADEVASVLEVLLATDQRETVLNPDYGTEYYEDGVLVGVDEREIIPNPNHGGPLYDDETAMAKAIVRALGTELARRETFMIVPGDSPFAYGPYWTVREAEKAWTAHLGPALGGQARLLRSVSWNRDEGTEQATDCVCGHVPEVHVVRNVRGGKVSSPTDCGVFRRREKCPCKGYTRRSA